jgi:hypothetical protein
MYLTTIIDWYSRFVVGWELSDSLDTAQVLEAVKKATSEYGATEKIIVDIDPSGLIANGKTYEAAQKGYFCKKKNQKGYQLSAAFCGGDNRETISLYLDSGKVQGCSASKQTHPKT